MRLSPRSKLYFSHDSMLSVNNGNSKLHNKGATLYYENHYITLEISYIIHIFSKVLRLLCLRFLK